MTPHRGEAQQQRGGGGAAGKVSRVVVWRLDRLGRTAKGLTALFAELLERRVNLVSLRDSIDLNTAAGRLMANVLASVAQYETEVRAERGGPVSRSRARRARRGAARSRAGCSASRPIRSGRSGGMKHEGEHISAIARATGLSRPTVYARLRMRV